MLEANALVKVDGGVVAAPDADVGLVCASLLEGVEGVVEEGTAVTLPLFFLHNPNRLNRRFLRLPLQPGKADGLLIFDQKEDIVRVIQRLFCLFPAIRLVPGCAAETLLVQSAEAVNGCAARLYLTIGQGNYGLVEQEREVHEPFFMFDEEVVVAQEAGGWAVQVGDAVGKLANVQGWRFLQNMVQQPAAHPLPAVLRQDTAFQIIDTIKSWDGVNGRVAHRLPFSFNQP